MRLLSLLLSFCIALNLLAQTEQPVQVKSNIVLQSDSTAIIQFAFQIEQGWHVYAPDVTEGPTPTTLNIEHIEGAQLSGALTASKSPISTYDKAFMAELRYYEGSVVFTQAVNIRGNYQISGYLEYGACNDQKCLPPTSVNFQYNGIAPKTAATPAIVAPLNVADTPIVAPVAKLFVADTTSADIYSPVSFDSYNFTHREVRSDWHLFWLCFLGGLLALLTPCVWPIIPMTVSFFIKRTQNRAKGIRDSLIYGVSIVVIYLVLGLVVTAIAGPSALNAISTNAWFNIFFTIMLVVFGVSFLGAFDLALPSSWSTAVDQKAEHTTGIVSIFLMAFTLALVSFSCTGPIVGFLLVELSTQGSLVAPAIGMFGFALALALPFTLFAMFPSWLQKIPHSGSWMVVVKVVLGFIELAFALKFFSVADLAYGWHLLDREVFICIWAALAFVLGLFLLGKINIAHASQNEDIGIVRLLGSIASFAFCLYLIPGLWGAPLKAVSAFCPPISTQDFVVVDNTPHAKFTNYEDGMAEAKRTGMPVLVDFTGFGCVNCRKMEQAVWSDPRVARILNNEYILISLYVDDKTPLPEKIVVDENITLRTVGDKWSYLQYTKFGVNAQPFYAPLNADGQLIGSPYAFDENVEHFVSFLKQKDN